MPRFAGLGGWEWLVILVIVILIFGVGRLAGLGPALGKTIRGFRKSLKGEEEEKPEVPTQTPREGKVEPPGKSDAR
ncbi:MAG: twin-arginine translocation protein, TatA/E family subunit [Dehalococcoidia bacterium]|nr:twin-arginine translocation protein, TatA/E family subunit [Dehalococcoidia bacterium]